MKLQNESGRSVIEMLTVISIIGVLTIVSFAAYRIAMSYYRANTLVEEASRRAFTVAEQIQTGKEVSLADFSKNAVAGSNFSSAVTQDTLHHQFALQINNVAPSVCKNILNMVRPNSPLRYVSDSIKPFTPITDCAEEDSNYTMVFNFDYSTHDYELNTEEQALLNCKSTKKTITMCNGTQKECCPDNGNVCEDEKLCCQGDGSCAWSDPKYGTDREECDTTTNTCHCKQGYFRNSNNTNCTECTLSGEKLSTSEECSRCNSTASPRFWSKKTKKCYGPCKYSNNFHDLDGTCRSCTVAARYYTTKEECEKCGDAREALDGDKCDKACRNIGKFKDINGMCHDCSDTTSFPAEPEECSRCTSSPYHRAMNGEQCEKLDHCLSDYFQDSSGNCQSCSSIADYNVDSENDCDVCDGKRVYANGKCELKCETGEFKDSEGSCQSCSNPSVWATTEARCLACLDTDSPRQFANGKCYPKCSGTQIIDSNGNCQNCTVGESFPDTANNQCISCSELNRYTVSQEVCAYCPNTREFVDNQYCDLICPSTHFKNKDGTCIPCNHNKDVHSSEEQCNKCKTAHARWWNSDGEWCKLGGDCAQEYFKDSSGACHQCSENANISSTVQNCSKCSGRNFANNTCYPACPANSYFKDGSCHNCVNGQTFASGNYCKNCDDNTKYETSEERCNSCGNERLMMNVTENNVTKPYCVRNCPDDHFRNTNGNCTACSNDDKNGRETSAEQCSRCATSYPRHMEGNYCKLGGNCPSGYFQDKNGLCHQCSESTEAQVSDATACAACNETQNPRVYENGFCYPRSETCASGQFKTINGACVSCEKITNTFDIQVESEAECNKCPQRVYAENAGIKYCGLCPSEKYYRTDLNKCDSCSKKLITVSEKACKACGEDYVFLSSGYCKQPCSDATQFMDKSGNCQDCSSTSPFEPADSAQCNRCPQRTMDGNYCIIGCGNNEFENDRAECVSCSENNAISSTPEQCALCANRSMNSDNKCVLNNCPTGTFKDNSGNCTSCDKTGNIKADQNQCNLCSKRFYAYIANNWTCTVCTNENTFISIRDRDDWAGCEDCGTTDVKVSIEASCNACSNRVFVAYNDGTRKGKCYSCDSTELLPLTEQECSLCGNRRAYLGNNKCAPICTRGETFRVSKTNNEFNDEPTAGSCAPCDNHYATITTREDCNYCSSQRTWIENARGDGEARCVWKGNSGWFQNSNLNWTECNSTFSKPIENSSEARQRCLDCGNRHIKENNDGTISCVRNT